MPELPEEIVTQPDELAECCRHLASVSVLGFDTEFVGEDTYLPRLCLLQLATPERLILIDPLTAGPLDEFWRVLTDPARTVIIHGGREEMRLCQFWTGSVPTNLIDLQLVAGLVGLIYPIGHGTLVQQVLGVQLSKGETLTEWRSRPLTRQQIRYAFDDVRYLLAIWERLSAQVEQLGRRDWITEEMRRLGQHIHPEEVVQEKWRKLRGLGGLDRRRLAIVRAVFEWREGKAAQTNRPPRTIVRDDLIVEIARRNPSRARDLQVIRGLAHRDLDAIQSAVEEGRRVPSDQCPTVAERENDPTQVALLTSLLVAVLGDFCARQRLAANLVASNQELKLLGRAAVSGSPPPAECLLTQGWRGQFVLPELQGVLEGRRAIRVVRPASEMPFELVELPQT